MGKSYCIFSAQYLPHMGGVENYTYNLAKKLVEHGNAVTVVTSNTESVLEYEETEGIRVYRFPVFNFMKGRYPVLICNRRFRQMHKALKKKKFDFVIVNTRFYIHSLYGQWFAWKRHIRNITIDHGSSHLSMGSPVLDFMGSVYEHAITRIGRIFCKDYYGVSAVCADWLRHFHIQAKGILYNSVDVEKIEKIIERGGVWSYREKYGIRAEDTVITFTGRLLPEKGVPQLIEAFERVRKRCPDTYLFLAGDGKLEQFVEEHRSTHVIPLGRQPFEEVISLLSETDIFCLPSFSEGFSTSILEAIVCRCYVVTTERGGAKETFPTEDYGKVIKNNEVPGLTEALIQAVENPEGRRSAVELAYDRLKENFTWDIAASKVELMVKRKEKGCRANY